MSIKFTIKDEAPRLYEHRLDLIVRQYVNEGRRLPTFMWHHLMPGDLVRFSTEFASYGPRLVVSRVRVTETDGTTTKEFTRLVTLGPGPRLDVHDV